MKVFKRAVLLFVFLMVFWIMLTGWKEQEIVFAIGLSLLITLIFTSKSSVFSEIKFTPKSILYMFIYVFVFLSELVKSNFDVAARVASPKLPINPGIVKVKTKLKSKLGRIMLANSITLTPGTLTVETKGEYYYIHWIDVSAKNIQSATDEIVSKFEKYLEVIFG